MGYYPGYGDERSSAHEAAVQYVLGCLRPMNDEGLYWTISYARNDPQRGLREMSTPTLYKLIGIIQSLAFSQKDPENKNRHGRDRFIPDICSANYRSQRQRKAVIDSVYHFLYLTKGKTKVDAGVLHDMLRGLPCNRKSFVNCSLPVRRAQVEAVLKFMIASIENQYRDDFYRPRGMSINHDGTIIINSPELIDLLWRRHEEADRIIEMFIDEDAELGVIEARLDTHSALDIGVL